MFLISKPTEGEYVSQANIDKVFANGDFPLKNNEKGKYIWKVENESENNITISNGKRLKIQLSYNQNQGEIFGITLKKFDNGEEKEKISISKVNLAEIQEFLNYLKKIDLKAFSTNRVYLNGNSPNNQEITRQIETLLNSNDKTNLIKSLLTEENVTNEDIVNTGFRKRSLAEFKTKLETNTNEKEWQQFFQNNPWIFGYGLDYRFKGILQREYSASDPQASGKEEIKGDFLLGDNKFTTFVEIKRPDTKLFNKAQNRANAWQLSTDLFDAYSQILEQKSSGQIKFSHGDLHDDIGNKITQKPYDSKTILIIGSWSEVANCGDLEKQIKEKTFELFRRDSRNIEIITVDELYERACFIVNDKMN
jgi:hypothetical protein